MVTAASRRTFCLGLGAAALSWPPSAGAGPARRIAALEHRIVETVLALGVTPFAMQDPLNYRRWTVEPALPEGVRDVGTEPEPNIEYLAALGPDLIVIPAERQDLARLEAIAPVARLVMTPPEGVSEYDHFADVMRATAALLGRDRQAQSVIAGVEAAIRRAQALLSPLAGRAVYLATLVDERHLWVYGRANLFQAVLDRIGLVNAWDGESVFDVVGIERLAGRRDASLVYIENNLKGLPPGLAESPLWQALPFVRANRVHGIASVSPFGALPTASRFARLFSDRLSAIAAGDG